MFDYVENQEGANDEEQCLNAVDKLSGKHIQIFIVRKRCLFGELFVYVS